MKLTKNNIITLDFETFYGKDYTLSGKMNMSEYIRDGRFSVHGVAIKVGTNPTTWYTGAHIPMALKAIQWNKYAVLCHNTPFDGFILSQQYGIVPKFYLDTLSMSRALHGHSQRHDLNSLAVQYGLKGKVNKQSLINTKDKPELTEDELRDLGVYACDDVNDTHSLFWSMLPHMPANELKLIDLTVRMFTDPVLMLDQPRVQAELEKQVGGKVAALMRTGVTGDQLLSNEKFAQLLRDKGVEPPLKISPSTGKLTYAFAKSDLDFQALSDQFPEVKDLCNARMTLKSTIGETRAQRFIEAGRDGMKFPILLNYCGAHTTRWSGGNKLNLQNLPRGGELRKSLLAPKGYKIVVADSAQIEARVLAWLAQQDDIVEAFAKKQDVYKLMASAIYGKKLEDITKDERFLGKVCVLGLGYGMGPDKLRDTLAKGAMGPKVQITQLEAAKIVTIYRKRNYKIKKLWDQLDVLLRKIMAVTPSSNPVTCPLGPIELGPRFARLPSGLFLQYFGLRSDSDNGNCTYLTLMGRRSIYGGMLAENLVQALSRCIIAEQMLKVSEKYRVVTMTHDEIVVIAPNKQADKCLEDMLKIMSTPPDWAPDLPLAAEGGFDDCYSK